MIHVEVFALMPVKLTFDAEVGQCQAVETGDKLRWLSETVIGGEVRFDALTPDDLDRLIEHIGHVGEAERLKRIRFDYL
ncbi:MAG: hypothetical protein HPY45_08260 [Anaerolineae bacterium]|nr:hypothetical protein [Anaerolineae bacterium]